MEKLGEVGGLQEGLCSIELLRTRPSGMEGKMLKREGAGFAERQSAKGSCDCRFRLQVSFNVADALGGGQTHTRMSDKERGGPHNGFRRC